MEPNVPTSSAGNAGQSESLDVRKGDVRSTISSLLASAQDHPRPASFRPEVDVKGNVKLFKSCIEKGDLEYLKTLQQPEEDVSSRTGIVADHSTEPCHEQADEVGQGDPEWVPVDVKKLKSMFSSGGPTNQGKATHTRRTRDDVHSTMKSNHSPSKIHTERVFISESDVNLNMFSSGQESSQSLSEGRDVQAPRKVISNLKLLSQETPCCTQTQEDTVHQAELVGVEEDAIDSQQQATKKEKAISYVVQNEKTCWDSERKSSPSPSYIMSEHESVCYLRNKVATADTVLEGKQTSHACDVEGPDGTEVVQKGHLKAAVKSLQSASTEECREVKEEVVGGNLQAALDSLGKSNFNVTKGDFRTAMISRNTSKSHTEHFKKTEAKVELLIESKSTPSTVVIKHGLMATEELSAASAEPTSPGQTTSKPATCSTLQKQPQTQSVAPTPKSPVGPKPAIPPKPDHLKANSSQVNTIIDMSTKSENLNESQPVSSEIRTHSKEAEPPHALLIKPMSYKDALCKGLSQTTDCVAESKLSQMDPVRQATYSLDAETKTVDATEHAKDIAFIHQVRSSPSPHRTDDISSLVNDSNINLLQNRNATEGKSPQNCLAEGSNEDSIGFQEALHNFEGKKEGKRAPVKPKRVKIAQSVGQNPVNTGQMCSTQTCEQNKVLMREKKARSETEDERRQRLSAHMDDIMRGNMTTAMEIFDNLRKQEQLKTILTKVEEIEEDTSQVDVKSLRGIFENVPAWVVTPRVRKPHKHSKVEQKVEKSELPKDDTESMYSMELVFGDLERASAEIMKLKDQTLARLMDIEEAIKKALYSVSALKSDSDIASLSGLFKESLGTSQSCPITSNIRKISIGSSRAVQAEVTESSNAGLSVISEAKLGSGLEAPDKKTQSSPPASPSFISIESAVRKAESSSLPAPLSTTGLISQCSSKSGETFRSTKTFKCNSHTLNMTCDPKEDTARSEASCSPYSPLNQKCQVTVLEVQTAPEGGIAGTKTAQENYETNQYGDHLFSTSSP